MEWSAEGIVLGRRRHGEADVILELLTRERGRHLGLVKGGAGTRLRPVLQPGNSVHATWRARLDEHLGNYSVEPVVLRAASFLIEPHAAFGVAHLAALCRLLPERDPHPGIHDELATILDHFADRTELAVRVTHFELRLLADLGFGLDLDRCAASGDTVDLVYVSPRSGRAVSRRAGEPWRDRLLRLPGFLRGEPGTQTPSAEDLADGFALTGFFLGRYVIDDSAVSAARDRFVSAVTRPAIRQNPAAREAAGPD